MKVVDVEVGELFQIHKGDPTLTFHFAHKNAGEFPIYSASLRGPLAFSNRFDYCGDHLTATSNGYAGTIQITSGKFSVNGDRVVFVPKSDWHLLDLDYVAYQLQPKFRQAALGRIVDGTKNEFTKLSPQRMASEFLEIVLSDDDEPDFLAMAAIGQKIRNFRVHQRRLSNHLDLIAEIAVQFELPGDYRTVELGDRNLFRLSIGTRILQSQLIDSGIPVISSNVGRPVGFTADAGSMTFEHPSLIWGIDGNFDWSYIEPQSPFVPTDHCGRVEILEASVDPEYLLIELKSTKTSYGFDRTFRANLKNVAEVSARIPIDSEGRFDLPTQRRTVTKSNQVERVRDRACRSLAEVSSAGVEFDLDYTN